VLNTSSLKLRKNSPRPPLLPSALLPPPTCH
jgi:hypothetical protein